MVTSTEKFDVNELRVASPCHMPWESMTGDERVRRCDSCELQVFNTAAMSAGEIDALIRGRSERLCIRLYRRADGTVLTRDCPKGFREYRRRVVRVAASAFATVLSFVSFAGAQTARPRPDVPVGTSSVQNPAESFSISGTVTDPQGALVPGTTISLVSADGRVMATASTNDNGEFQFAVLPGKYSLRAEHAGFEATVVETINVRGSANAVVNISMTLAAGTVWVGIFAEEPVIDINSSTVQTKVDRRKIDLIPH